MRFLDEEQQYKGFHGLLKKMKFMQSLLVSLRWEGETTGGDGKGYCEAAEGEFQEFRLVSPGELQLSSQQPMHVIKLPGVRKIVILKH